MPDTPQPKSAYAQKIKGKTGQRRIINAAGYSRDGLLAAYRSEAAFRQLVWLHSGLLLLLWWLDWALVPKMVLVSASFVSLVVELFNTGLEALTDRVSTEQHPLSKVAKDVGSAAQLLALMMTALLWGMAFYYHHG